MKIIVLGAHQLNLGDMDWSGIKKLGDVVIYDGIPEVGLLHGVKDAEILLSNKVAVTKEVIEAAPKLRYISTLATGYNFVDLDAAKRRGIFVSNIPAYSTDSVAQLVFAFLLAFSHHVEEHSRGIHEGEWIESKYDTYWKFPLIELAGKTLGIIGYGKIGQRVEEIAKAFHMKVIKYGGQHKQTGDFVSFDTLLEKSDFVTLHAPLNAKTEKLMNEKAFQKMKKTAYFVNTARGGLVDEKALVEALEKGRIAGAGLDVIREEPMKEDSLLPGTKNLFMTPHIGWAPYDARVRLMKIAEENIAAFLDKEPINVVNP